MARPFSKTTTWNQVADALGVSTRALGLWRKKDDAPKEPDIDAWLAYQDSAGIGKGESPELKKIKIEIAQEQLAKLRRENAIGEGKMIPRETIAEFLSDLSYRIDAMIGHEFITSAAPRVVGQPIASVREELAASRERIRVATHAGILKWEADNGDA
jgi:hypothetical protein